MDPSGPTKENVVAVVVTYHPDAEFADRWRALALQFVQVLVIDNHSTEAERTPLRALSDEIANLVLVSNPENLGIATALNQGCRHALEQGAAWVVTFDQDSAPVADLLSCLASDWSAEPCRERIGLIGVNFRSRSGSTRIPPQAGLADARAVITSGSLLNLAAWQDVGPFREDFFIDEVDHEYALRMRRQGWLVKITRRVMMEHAIGSPRPVRFGIWRPALSHHSALRRYYMVRNRVLLARAHFDFDPRFVCGQLARSFRESATVLLFEPEKKAKLRAMLRGLLDGIRGRSGRSVLHVP